MAIPASFHVPSLYFKSRILGKNLQCTDRMGMLCCSQLRCEVLIGQKQLLSADSSTFEVFSLLQCCRLLAQSADCATQSASDPDRQIAQFGDTDSDTQCNTHSLKIRDIMM